MAARDRRKEIIQEFEGLEGPEKQRALRFLLQKMGPQHGDSRTLWDDFAQVEKDYPAMAEMLHRGRSYPLQGEFNDAREGLAQEFGNDRWNQDALRSLLSKMGPQLDSRRVWEKYGAAEKNSPQLYYKLGFENDPNAPSWHEFESMYTNRIPDEPIFDLMKEYRQSRVTENTGGTYATARIVAALRMTKGDTEKAASFLASMGKKD